VTEPQGTADRVVASALRCLARTGLRAMTVDDVAADAGVSRATLYRAFPGGRDTILAAVVDAELARLLDVVRTATEAAPDLRGALVAGLRAAAAWLEGHEVLDRLMFDEPATLLTHLEFEQMDRTLAALTARVAPLLARFVDPVLAERVGSGRPGSPCPTCCSPRTTSTSASPATSAGWSIATWCPGSPPRPPERCVRVRQCRRNCLRPARLTRQ